MAYKERLEIYKEIEQERGTKIITFATSDRPNCETQIAQDCIDAFVNTLNGIGPTEKISLFIHTNGGNTSTAWRIANLLQCFCDHLEVIIPLKAMSSGTLISLGANTLVMTKQAALGPIDPSLTHPLGPTLQTPAGLARVPVSVEAVRGYLDAATQDFGIKDDAALASILIDLSSKIHPLVLGEIFRSRSQIRFLADKLVRKQVTDDKKIKTIIEFLCSDSGSHDYTINRREAESMGLHIEKPDMEFYKKIEAIHNDYTNEMQLLEPYSPEVMLGGNTNHSYSLVRSLVESSDAGCYAFLSVGELSLHPQAVPGSILDKRTFEGWRKVA